MVSFLNDPWIEKTCYEQLGRSPIKRTEYTSTQIVSNAQIIEIIRQLDDKSVEAQISDSKHYITAIFSFEALREFYLEIDCQFKDIKGSYLIIEKFYYGYSHTNNSLIMHVDKFSYCGGESAVYGNPISIDKTSLCKHISRLDIYNPFTLDELYIHRSVIDDVLSKDLSLEVENLIEKCQPICKENCNQCVKKESDAEFSLLTECINSNFFLSSYASQSTQICINPVKYDPFKKFFEPVSKVDVLYSNSVKSSLKTMPQLKNNFSEELNAALTSPDKECLKSSLIQKEFKIDNLTASALSSYKSNTLSSSFLTNNLPSSYSTSTPPSSFGSSIVPSSLVSNALPSPYKGNLICDSVTISNKKATNTLLSPYKGNLICDSVTTSNKEIFDTCLGSKLIGSNYLSNIDVSNIFYLTKMSNRMLKNNTENFNVNSAVEKNKSNEAVKDQSILIKKKTKLCSLKERLIKNNIDDFSEIFSENNVDIKNNDDQDKELGFEKFYISENFYIEKPKPNSLISKFKILSIKDKVLYKFPPTIEDIIMKRFIGSKKIRRIKKQDQMVFCSLINKNEIEMLNGLLERMTCHNVLYIKNGKSRLGKYLRPKKTTGEYLNKSNGSFQNFARIPNLNSFISQMINKQEKKCKEFYIKEFKDWLRVIFCSVCKANTYYSETNIKVSGVDSSNEFFNGRKARFIVSSPIADTFNEKYEELKTREYTGTTKKMICIRCTKSKNDNGSLIDTADNLNKTEEDDIEFKRDESKKRLKIKIQNKSSGMMKTPDTSNSEYSIKRFKHEPILFKKRSNLDKFFIMINNNNKIKTNPNDVANVSNTVINDDIGVKNNTDKNTIITKDTSYKIVPTSNATNVNNNIVESITVNSNTLENMAVNSNTLENIAVESITVENITVNNNVLENIAVNSNTLENIAVESITVNNNTEEDITVNNNTLENIIVDNITADYTCNNNTCNNMVADKTIMPVENIIVDNIIADYTCNNNTEEDITVNNNTLENIIVDNIIADYTCNNNTCNNMVADNIITETLLMDNATCEAIADKTIMPVENIKIDNTNDIPKNVFNTDDTIIEDIVTESNSIIRDNIPIINDNKPTGSQCNFEESLDHIIEKSGNLVHNRNIKIIKNESCTIEKSKLFILNNTNLGVTILNKEELLNSSHKSKQNIGYNFSFNSPFFTNELNSVDLPNKLNENFTQNKKIIKSNKLDTENIVGNKSSIICDKNETLDIAFSGDLSEKIINESTAKIVNIPQNVNISLFKEEEKFDKSSFENSKVLSEVSLNSSLSKDKTPLKSSLESLSSDGIEVINIKRKKTSSKPSQKKNKKVKKLMLLDFIDSDSDDVDFLNL